MCVNFRQSSNLRLLVRFALILHIRVDPVDQMAVHVLWLQHSFIHLEEGHHPRELFLTECCGTMHPRLLKRKIKVDLIDPRGSVPKYTGYSDPWRYFSRQVRHLNEG